MPTHHCDLIWKHLGLRRGYAATALALLGTLGLAGCVVEVPTPHVTPDQNLMPADETGPWTNRAPSEKERLLARSDFSVELIRFTDLRRPRSMEMETPDQIIEDYVPDTLLQGVTTQVPAIVGKYLAYRPRMEKDYAVELELNKLTTTIKTGSFWSGSWGRYAVELEMTAIARRPDSTVVLQKTYHVQREQGRESYNGYGPSKERDRARLYDLTENTLREVAAEIGWDIRQRDARMWRPKPAVPLQEATPPVVPATPSAVPLTMPESATPDLPNSPPSEFVSTTVDVSSSALPEPRSF